MIKGKVVISLGEFMRDKGKLIHKMTMVNV